MLQSRQAMGLSAPNDRLMSAEQYRQCWSLSNLTHYLRNGVTPMNSSCLRAVTPLIERIIADADSLTASSGSEPTLIGYFGHAETLLPLLSALQIPGCSYMPKGEADSPETYADLHKHWQLQQITPLGANFALFLLKSESGRTYAALRLNGHPVVLPGGCEIIPWQSLAARWRSLMAK